MRKCSFCQADMPKGSHAKTCRVPECKNLLCSACYYRHRYCPEHLEKSQQMETSGAADDLNTLRDQPELRYENESVEQRKCRFAVERFHDWLRFYTKLPDPKDMNIRAFSFSIAPNQTPYTTDITIHFKGGSDLRLVLLCANDVRDTETNPVDDKTEPFIVNKSRIKPSNRKNENLVSEINYLLAEFFAKNLQSKASSQVAIGIFYPSKQQENFEEKMQLKDDGFWNKLDKGNVSVFLISEKMSWFVESDRLSRCIKNLFSSLSIEEAEKFVRKQVRSLLLRYTHLLADTVVDQTGFPMEFVMYVVKRMAQEKICRYRKAQNGIEIKCVEF